MITVIAQDAQRDRFAMEKVATQIESRSRDLKGYTQLFTETVDGQATLSFFFEPGLPQAVAIQRLDSLIGEMRSDRLLGSVKTLIR